METSAAANDDAANSVQALIDAAVALPKQTVQDMYLASARNMEPGAFDRLVFEEYRRRFQSPAVAAGDHWTPNPLYTLPTTADVHRQVHRLQQSVTRLHQNISILTYLVLALLLTIGFLSAQTFYVRMPITSSDGGSAPIDVHITVSSSSTGSNINNSEVLFVSGDSGPPLVPLSSDNPALGHPCVDLRPSAECWASGSCDVQLGQNQSTNLHSLRYGMQTLALKDHFDLACAQHFGVPLCYCVAVVGRNSSGGPRWLDLIGRVAVLGRSDSVVLTHETNLACGSDRRQSVNRRFKHVMTRYETPAHERFEAVWSDADSVLMQQAFLIQHGVDTCGGHSPDYGLEAVTREISSHL